MGLKYLAKRYGIKDVNNNIYPEVAPVVNSDAAACNEMNDTILEEM